jgi:hypothetical protein
MATCAQRPVHASPNVEDPVLFRCWRRPFGERPSSQRLNALSTWAISMSSPMECRFPPTKSSLSLLALKHLRGKADIIEMPFWGQFLFPSARPIGPLLARVSALRSATDGKLRKNLAIGIFRHASVHHRQKTYLTPSNALDEKAQYQSDRSDEV